MSRQVLIAGSYAEVRAFLGVSPATLWRYMHQYPERFEKIGRRLVFYSKGGEK